MNGKTKPTITLLYLNNDLTKLTMSFVAYVEKHFDTSRIKQNFNNFILDEHWLNQTHFELCACAENISVHAW